MLSKGKIWEILAPNKTVLDYRKPLHGLFCYDQHVFQYLKQKFDLKLQVVMGNEISQDWIDQKLKTMDLFGGVDSFLIHFAESIPAELIDQFLEPENLILEQRHIILNFSKDSKLFKKISASENFDCIQIDPPAFWEERELLRFLSQQKSVYLSFEAEQFFCERVPFDIGAYSDILDILAVSADASKGVSIEEIKEVLTQNKFDQFKLAELFGSKKMNQFYRELIELVEQNQDCYGFLYFMHNHMQKVHDPSYADSKKRLSKYDKQIIHQQKLWKNSQSARAANYFNELLTIYKMDKDGFLGRLKGDYLKVLFT